MALILAFFLSSAVFASTAGAQQQIALSKKDPCYGWFYSTTLRFKKTQANVVHASEAQQPCAPAIEKFKTEVAALPAACEKPRLKTSAPLLRTQLAAAAASWNKRGWQKWEVKQDGPLSAEFGKVREFYLRELQSGCDTRR